MSQPNHLPTIKCEKYTLESNFQYSRLPDASTWIRLLRVKGQTEEGNLDCDLLVQNLEEEIDFYAISYTWGDLNPRVYLKLNSEYWLGVRPNCEYALHQVLLRQGRNVLVWIDAVCIDQTDIEEKSQQVSIMALIYAKAVKVYACVGNHADDSKLLFDMLNRDASRLRIPTNHPYRWSRTERLRLRAWLLSHHFEYTRKVANALFAFLSRAYFSRVWVVQELYTSRSTDFLCDTEAVDSRLVCFLRNIVCYAQLLLFQSSLPTDGSPIGFIGHFVKALNRGMTHVYILRRIQAHASIERDVGKGYLCMEAIDKGDVFESLHIVVNDMAELHCEDLRDKVFAISAMTKSWPGWKDVRPDYNISVEDLAVQVLQADIQDQSSIRNVFFEQRLVNTLGLGANSVQKVLLAHQRVFESDPSLDPNGIEADGLDLMYALLVRDDRSVLMRYPRDAEKIKNGFEETVFQQDATAHVVDGYVYMTTNNHALEWTLIIPNSFQAGDWIFIDFWRDLTSWTFAFLGRVDKDSGTIKVVDYCLRSPMQPKLLVTDMFKLRGLRYIQKLGIETLTAGTTVQQHELTESQAVSLLHQARLLLSSNLWLERYHGFSKKTKSIRIPMIHQRKSTEGISVVVAGS